MGHAGDPLGYEKASKDPDFTRQQYKLAAPMLQILTAPDPYGLADADTVQALKARLEAAEEKIEAQATALQHRREVEHEIQVQAVIEAIRKNPDLIKPHDDPQ